MIQVLANKFQKEISSLLFLVFYCEMIVSASTINSNKDVYLFKNNIAFSNSKNNGPFSFDNNITINHTDRNDSELKISGQFINLNDNNQKPENQRSHHSQHNNNHATANAPGPGQPEMSAFQSVSSSNMVDLFSGDFS